MYEQITRYYKTFSEAGNWIIDHKNDGSRAHPIQLPFAEYSETVKKIHFGYEGVYDTQLYQCVKKKWNKIRC